METINVQLQVGWHPWSRYDHNFDRFIVCDNNYEPGWPTGEGKTIQEAIENYLEAAEDFYKKVLNYKWS